MLRNDYFTNYKEKSKYELDNKYADDDNYVFQKYQPLSEKTIAELPSKHLLKFVDEILTNKKVTGLLYSSNAKKEIGLVIKSGENLKLNAVKMKYKSKPQNTPIDIVVNRKKKETIEMIRGETDIYKTSRNRYQDVLKGQNDQFYKTIVTERKDHANDNQISLNRNRRDRFERIFMSIKDKIDKYNTNERRKTATNTTFTNNVTSYFSNTESSIIKKVDLPDLRLDMNDVYSRLYHNAVYVATRNDDKLKKSCIMETSPNLNLETQNPIQTHTQTFKLKSDASIKKIAQTKNSKNTKLIIKNVIDSTNGKQFTIKITDEILMKCFSKHSGGPVMQVGKSNITPSLGNKNGVYTLNLLEIKNDEGNSLLHISVIDNFIELIEYLLIKGVNINCKNNDGDTPLHLAMKIQDYDVIKMLLDANAELDMVNKKNETAFDLASVKYIF